MADTIKIGVLHSLSGTMAISETVLKDTVLMATDEINTKGISGQQISHCKTLLDEGLQAWRTRPLDDTPYVILDTRYGRVRIAGQVVDCAVLVAIGVTASGHRRVLGVSVDSQKPEKSPAWPTLGNCPSPRTTAPAPWCEPPPRTLVCMHRMR